MKNQMLKALGAAAFVAVSVSAQAADLRPAYTKAPPAPPAPVYNWTGFYLGGGGGYGLWNIDTNAMADPVGPGSVLTQTTTNGGKGWFGTLTAGFDYQFNMPIVAGVFGDYDFADISGTLNSSTATNFFNPLGGTEKESAAWAAGARVGWLVTPTILTYVNGGYSGANFDRFAVDNLQAFPPGPAATGFSVGAHTYNGWFIGSGVEGQIPFLSKGWFIRTEYRYADYGTTTLPVVTATGAIAALNGVPFDLRLHPIVQTVRTEVTYKFNWWGQSAYTAPPAPPAPVNSWTGLYLGGGGGYGMSNIDTNGVVDPSSTFAGVGFGPGLVLTQTTTNGGKGWFGTLTAGFDYQFNMPIVAGVFGDYDFADISGTLNSSMATNFFNALGGTEKESAAWAAGARVGWLVTPTILTYVNGGYSGANFDRFAVDNLAAAAGLTGGGTGTPTGFSAGAHTYNGWFIGSGVEGQIPFLSKGWFIRTEYRYADYGTTTLPVVTATGAIATVGGIPVDVTLHPVVQTVRTEVTYKFNWWGR